MTRPIWFVALLTAALSCTPAGSSVRDSSVAADSATRKADAPPPRFLALGDSYTIGEGVAETDRWPVQLARELRAIGTSVADPEILAQTGWTVKELNNAINATQPECNFALVTLLIGVNDQYRGGDANTYRAAFRKMLARAVGFAGGEASHVIVVSIPDWGVTPFAAGRDPAEIAVAIDRFNAVNREEAQAAGAQYVNITQLSRKKPGEKPLTVSDGLHPTADVYKEWTTAILPVANSILRSEGR